MGSGAPSQLVSRSMYNGTGITSEQVQIWVSRSLLTHLVAMSESFTAMPVRQTVVGSSEIKCALARTLNGARRSPWQAGRCEIPVTFSNHSLPLSMVYMHSRGSITECAPIHLQNLSWTNFHPIRSTEMPTFLAAVKS